MNPKLALPLVFIVTTVIGLAALYVSGPAELVVVDKRGPNATAQQRLGPLY